MKIRIIAVFYTVLILLCGLLIWKGTEKKVTRQIDMLDLNTRCSEISDRISCVTVCTTKRSRAL